MGSYFFVMVAKGGGVIRGRGVIRGNTVYSTLTIEAGVRVTFLSLINYRYD